MADINSSLIDSFILEAQIAQGIPAAWLENQGVTVRGVAGREMQKRIRAPRWTPEEEAFVIENRGTMAEAEIAERLGRSQNSIKCRGYRIQANSPRYAPGYVSGNQIAHLLGVDSHSPPAWIDNGFLEGEHFPYPGRVCRRTTWSAFLRFLIRPASWVYFKVERIKNDHLRRLVELAQAKWGDQWLSTRQAAELRGCSLDDIQNAINHGRLHGYHAGSLERRREWGWARWFVLRSEVEQLPLPWGCDKGHTIQWSPRADAFIIRACRDEISYEDMARMMKWPVKRVMYRASLLRRQGLVAAVKPRGKVSGRVSNNVCVICGKPARARKGSILCDSQKCRTEYHNQQAKLRYQKEHPNYKTGIRKPRAKKVKPEKPPKPVVLCEICGERAVVWHGGKICSSPECKAERTRRFARAAYQRKVEKRKNERTTAN